MTTPGERLKEKRTERGFERAEDFARAYGFAPSTYRAHESGARNYGKERAASYASKLGTTAEYLMFGTGKEAVNHNQELTSVGTAPTVELRPSGALIGPVQGFGSSSNRTLPVFGLAECGAEGRFIFNGEAVDYVMRPETLKNVSNAYAVRMVGDSMEDRYYADELVAVNPARPVTKGCFVVVQLHPDRPGEPPLALVKRFLGLNDGHLRLEQLNPRQVIEIPRAHVKSIHRIVYSES